MNAQSNVHWEGVHKVGECMLGAQIVVLIDH